MKQRYIAIVAALEQIYEDCIIPVYGLCSHFNYYVHYIAMPLKAFLEIYTRFFSLLKLMLNLVSLIALNLCYIIHYIKICNSGQLHYYLFLIQWNDACYMND